MRSLFKTNIISSSSSRLVVVVVVVVVVIVVIMVLFNMIFSQLENIYQTVDIHVHPPIATWVI